VVVLLGAACSGVPPAAAPPAPRGVFLIVMESRSSEEALSGSFTASLAPLLATIEDLMGVGRLAQATQSQPMTDLIP
jgi:hypothetical protein